MVWKYFKLIVISWYCGKKLDPCFFVSKTVVREAYVDDFFFWSCSQSDINKLLIKRLLCDWEDFILVLLQRQMTYSVLNGDYYGLKDVFCTIESYSYFGIMPSYILSRDKHYRELKKQIWKYMSLTQCCLYKIQSH